MSLQAPKRLSTYLQLLGQAYVAYEGVVGRLEGRPGRPGDMLTVEQQALHRRYLERVWEGTYEPIDQSST